MSVILSANRVGNIIVVHAVGQITISGHAVENLRNFIHGFADGEIKNILLNLKEVSKIDEAGIGVLVSSHVTLTNRGGILKLMQVGNRIKNLLTITKLYTVFEVYDDEFQAICSFK